jgi:hypothetical protein
MIIIQSSASSSHREGQNNKVDYSAQTPEGGEISLERAKEEKSSSCPHTYSRRTCDDLAQGSVVLHWANL